MSVYVVAHQYDASRIKHWVLQYAAIHLRGYLDFMQAYPNEVRTPLLDVLASTIRTAYVINMTDRSRGFDMLQNAIISRASSITLLLLHLANLACSNGKSFVSLV